MIETLAEALEVGTDLETEITLVVNKKDLNEKGVVDNSKFVEYFNIGRKGLREVYGFSDLSLSLRKFYLNEKTTTYNFTDSPKESDKIRIISSFEKYNGEEDLLIKQKIVDKNDYILAEEKSYMFFTKHDELGYEATPPPRFVVKRLIHSNP